LDETNKIKAKKIAQTFVWTIDGFLMLSFHRLRMTNAISLG
jgi:hypothetical protein